MIDVWNRVMTNLTIAESGTCSMISSTSVDLPSKFPALAVEQVENRDAAVDLENSENAVYSMIRIQSFSQKSLTEARNVMNIACDAMRTMGYRRSFGPEPVLNAQAKGTYRMEARFSRTTYGVDEIPRFEE